MSVCAELMVFVRDEAQLNLQTMKLGHMLHPTALGKNELTIFSVRLCPSELCSTLRVQSQRHRRPCSLCCRLP
jgi:hypothetical protein